MKEQLDAVLERWNLLKHPFYQAWSAGTLPVEALRAYAHEYGRFIAALPNGWETLGDPETAAEEREHAELWDRFAVAVGAADRPQHRALPPQTEHLLRLAGEAFAKRASALGALYAFEAQQPATAQSKLEGLRRFYAFSAEAELYFDVHSSNHHEAAKLLRQIAALSAEEQAQALSACAQMAEAMWNALTGIHQVACS